MPTSTSLQLRMLLWLEILVIITAYNIETGTSGAKFCGPILTATMQVVCRSQYASRANDKRSGDNEYNADLFLNDETLTVSSPFAYHTVPFLADFGSATALQPRVRREHWTVKRGIYEDCCKKPCSLQVLLSYCA